MKNTPKISEAEWTVMRVLWVHAPRTSSEIVEELAPETGWKPNTIKTLLARLVKKGAIYAEKGKTREFSYAPQVTEAQCVKAESQTFLERVYSGSPLPMLANFIQQEKLSRQEIKYLRKLLDEMERKAK